MDYVIMNIINLTALSEEEQWGTQRTIRRGDCTVGYQTRGQKRGRRQVRVCG